MSTFAGPVVFKASGGPTVQKQDEEYIDYSENGKKIRFVLAFYTYQGFHAMVSYAIIWSFQWLIFCLSWKRNEQ